MKILVVEDDRTAAQFLTKGLAEAGHVVDHARDGEAGLDMALGGSHDALIVDRMLPKRDGISMVEDLRRRGVETPVLFLSALGEVDQRIQGFEAGGDDYVVKPYALGELLARLAAVVRRRSPEAARPALRVGDLELDRRRRTATRAGRRIDLQPREFRLLEYLMENAGQAVTRTMLLENVWDYHFDPQTNVIDVHVSRLRAKIDRDFDEPLLHTVRGTGYMVQEPDPR